MKHLDAALTSFANWIVLQLLSVLADEVPHPTLCAKCRNAHVDSTPAPEIERAP